MNQPISLDVQRIFLELLTTNTLQIFDQMLDELIENKDKQLFKAKLLTTLISQLMSAYYENKDLEKSASLKVNENLDHEGVLNKYDLLRDEIFNILSDMSNSHQNNQDMMDHHYTQMLTKSIIEADKNCSRFMYSHFFVPNQVNPNQVNPDHFDPKINNVSI